VTKLTPKRAVIVTDVNPKQIAKNIIGLCGREGSARPKQIAKNTIGLCGREGSARPKQMYRLDPHRTGRLAVSEVEKGCEYDWAMFEW
jgi:hypothetical protein